MATLAEILRERNARQAGPQLQTLPVQVPSLDEILQNAAAGSDAVQAPVVRPTLPEAADQENEYTATFSKLLDQALGTDWDAEAAKILEKQGLKPPTAPGPFNISKTQMLVALGPALGALFGGNAAMAAPAAAGVLSPHLNRWQEEQAKYEKQQAAYSQAATGLSEKMAARAEKRLAMLTPILTMNAAERAKNRIDTAKLGIDERNMTDKERKTAQDLMKLGLDRDKELFDRVYKQNQQVIAVLELTNKAAAEQAKQVLAEKAQAFKQWADRQGLLLEQGKLNEAGRHNRAAEAISTNRPEDKMKQIELALIMDKIQQGDMDTVYSLVFGNRSAKLPEEDKMALQQYTTIMGRDPKKMGFSPEQVETLRQRANQAAKKMGMPEFPAPKPGRDWWGDNVNWLKGILNMAP